MQIFDQNVFGVPVIVVATTCKTEAAHEGFDLVAARTAHRTDCGLGHNRKELFSTKQETFELKRSPRKKQIVQSQSVEEIGVAQMVAQVIAFEDAVTLQINVIFLAADAGLRDPFRFKCQSIQQQAFGLGPCPQRGGFSKLQRTDEAWMLPRRKRCTWFMNSAGDIGGCLDRSIASFFIRLQ